MVSKMMMREGMVHLPEYERTLNRRGIITVFISMSGNKCVILKATYIRRPESAAAFMHPEAVEEVAALMHPEAMEMEVQVEDGANPVFLIPLSAEAGARRHVLRFLLPN
jgi:hypothetical protein